MRKESEEREGAIEIESDATAFHNWEKQKERTIGILLLLYLHNFAHTRTQVNAIAECTHSASRSATVFFLLFVLTYFQHLLCSCNFFRFWVLFSACTFACVIIRATFAHTHKHTVETPALTQRKHLFLLFGVRKNNFIRSQLSARFFTSASIHSVTAMCLNRHTSAFAVWPETDGDLISNSLTTSGAMNPY